MDWTEQLLLQLDWYWTAMFRPRLEGMTDEEYLWEPVEGCWSIHRAEDGRMVMDGFWPPPDPPPVTTIAWRLGHISLEILAARVAFHFDGGREPTQAEMDLPASAGEAIARMEEHYDAWRDGIRGLDAEALAAPMGEPGPFRDDPMAGLVLHNDREIFHHAAEVALLRDLYRASDGGRRWRTAG
ncbi:MAG TPA: DinB family protein [Candidatus Dormibacteraeota bacterium]|nr:DinB family protein [Candidatus Dormibacteraeota bacterium]